MAHPKVSDEEFILLMKKHQSIAEMARILDMDKRSVQRRRDKLEIKHGVQLQSKVYHSGVRHSPSPKGRINLGMLNGIIIVFSDAHFWGERSTAFKGLLWAIQKLKPTVVIANGDIFDGAALSRFPVSGFDDWEGQPSVIQELKACQAAMGEIEEAAKKARSNVKLIWPVGNHDMRFEMKIANSAPEYANVHGVHLKDHFPEWTPCMSCWPTDTLVVKHRYKGGIHATHNNTVNAGLSIVTGHLHSAKVTPWTDYTGTRYGVDTGTLSDTFHRKFAYMEDGPRNWRSGFAVLTLNEGVLLNPELVLVHQEDSIQFRGEVVDVSRY